MILAAGEGTRLKPLTDTMAKPMVPIGPMPLLEHTLRLLKKYGITSCAINLHHKPATVSGYFGDGSGLGMALTYSREPALLGTAGAVRKLKDYFDTTFVLIYGDVYTACDLGALLEFHRGRKGLATIGLYNVPNPTECGIVELDKDSRIRRFLEKPRPEEVFSQLANAGVYVLEPGIMDCIPENSVCDFGRDVFPLMLSRGMPLYGYTIKEYLIDIGSMDKYQQAREAFKKGAVR